MERFLFRFSQTKESDGYVLKGAMLFFTWPGYAARTTADIDFLGHGEVDPAAIAVLFRRVCEIECAEDGMSFDPESVTSEVRREDQKYQGIRVKLRGRLGKTAGDVVIYVDIGFHDDVHPPPRRQMFPGLLAGLGQANILMYPPESVVSEKLDAMIQLGIDNSRIKDFYDLWMATRIFAFNMPALTEAISGTMKRRSTPIPAKMPICLTEEFWLATETQSRWRSFLRVKKLAAEPPPFPVLQEELRRFFGPVLQDLRAPERRIARWDAANGAWQEEKPL